MVRDLDGPDKRSTDDRYDSQFFLSAFFLNVLDVLVYVASVSISLLSGTTL